MQLMRKAFALLVFFLECCLFATDQTPRFVAGESVSFLGDDVTHVGLYIPYIRAFLALRHPNCKIRIHNLGLGGANATDSLGRIDDELLNYPSHKVFVIFGINDISRNIYLKSQANSEDFQKSRWESFEKAIRTLVRQFRKYNITPTLLTPVPFDEYNEKLTTQRRIGCNSEGLYECARIILKIASEENVAVIDLYTPISDLLKNHQDLMLMGNDRIIPRSKCSMAIMALIMEACGEGKNLPSATIDITDGIAQTNLSRIKNLKIHKRNISFLYAPESIAFPANKSYMVLDKAFPISEKINREILKIRDLPPGLYNLKINNQFIDTYHSEELESGINLALLPTPNSDIADNVLDLAVNHHRIVQKLRRIDQGNAFVKSLGENPEEADHTQADMALDKWLNSYARTSSAEFAAAHRRIISEYRLFRDQRSNIKSEENSALYKLWDTAKPVDYEISIEPCQKR